MWKQQNLHLTYFLLLPHAPLFCSFPLSPPSQAASENMLIRAPVKRSFRVYFPDEIRRRRLSHLHYTQSLCLGKRLCVILILFGNVVSSLQSLQLYHHGPLLQLVAFFIALHCTAFFNARRTHHWCLGYLILLNFSVLKITNILLYQKEILTMVLALHLVASPWSLRLKLKAGTKSKVGNLKGMLPQGGLGECFEGEAIGDSTNATILKLRKLGILSLLF